MPTKAEIVEFLKREFPQTKCTVEEVGGASATVKHHVGADELRPGRNCVRPGADGRGRCGDLCSSSR